jgi:hypothetical protein
MKFSADQGAQDKALPDAVRIAFEDAAVHVGWIPFVGIDDDVFGLAGALRVVSFSAGWNPPPPRPGSMF